MTSSDDVIIIGEREEYRFRRSRDVSRENRPMTQTLLWESVAAKQVITIDGKTKMRSEYERNFVNGRPLITAKKRPLVRSAQPNLTDGHSK